MIVSWVLAVVLALAPHPLYSYYAHLASRPGGISAMADQQLAAGVMWVPGSVTFLIVAVRLRPPLAHAAGSPVRTRAPRLARRALGGFMPKIAIPIAAHFLTGSILTLVIPAGRADRGGDLVRRAVAPGHGRTLSAAARRPRARAAHRRSTSRRGPSPVAAAAPTPCSAGYCAASLGTSWAISLGSKLAG